MFAASIAPSPAPAPLPSGVSARGEALLGRVSATDVQWGAFLPGVPDVTEFPQQRFAQITAQCARRGPPALRSYATAGGHPALQRSLAQYLRQVRSVQCEPEQILITEGVHQAVDLLSRMLADAGDIAWVEDPGYWGTRNILRMNGLQVDAAWPCWRPRAATASGWWRTTTTANSVSLASPFPRSKASCPTRR